MGATVTAMPTSSSPSRTGRPSSPRRRRRARIVVDFWAEWCGPCRMIAPHFARLSEEMTNWIFLKVDVDSQDTLSAECGIRAMPTFQFYDSDGKKIDELVGASIDALTTKLKTL